MTDTTDLERALVNRGVNEGLAAWIVVWMDAAAIDRTLRWYDAPEQRGRVGPGMLVQQLRAGGIAPSTPAVIAAPCTHTPELEAEWTQAIADLDAPVLTSWLAHCHPHARDEHGWTLGAQRYVLGWLAKYLPQINRAVGAPVRAVVCDRQGTPR